MPGLSFLEELAVASMTLLYVYIYMYMYMFQYFLENLAVHFNVFYQPGFPSRIVPNPNLQSKNM